MKKYIFLKDFPPTDYKKGDEFEDRSPWVFTQFELATFLAIGIIKEVEEEKEWQPQGGNNYWFINSLGESCEEIFSRISFNDSSRLAFGNCFRTKQEAEAMRDKIKELLKGKK